jgi:hypothetical protein
MPPKRKSLAVQPGNAKRSKPAAACGNGGTTQPDQDQAYRAGGHTSNGLPHPGVSTEWLAKQRGHGHMPAASLQQVPVLNSNAAGGSSNNAMLFLFDLQLEPSSGSMAGASSNPSLLSGSDLQYGLKPSSIAGASSKLGLLSLPGLLHEPTSKLQPTLGMPSSSLGPVDQLGLNINSMQGFNSDAPSCCSSAGCTGSGKFSRPQPR